MLKNDPSRLDARPATSAQILSLSELNGTPPANAAAAVNPNDQAVNPLHQVKTKLTVSVGTVELSVGDLLAAKEHQVLRLDRTIDQPVEIMIEGQVVARGTLVAVGDHFGVMISELPLSLKV